MDSAASLLVAWQLKNKSVLIVGGGEVASSRLQSVLAADANVTLVASSSTKPGLHPIIQHLVQTDNRLTYCDRDFIESDLDAMDMVLTAIDDVETSRGIANACRSKRIPINAADIPSSCDFYFGSQIQRGPLQILVSTNGKGPKLANIIRTTLEKALPDNVEAAINNVGILRTKLRLRAPGVGGEVGKRRMKWMVDICSNWEINELATLDEKKMETLLDEGWESMTVPKASSIVGLCQTWSRISRSTWSSGLLPFLGGIVVGCSAFLYARRR